MLIAIRKFGVKIINKVKTREMKISRNVAISDIDVIG